MKERLDLDSPHTGKDIAAGDAGTDTDTEIERWNAAAVQLAELQTHTTSAIAETRSPPWWRIAPTWWAVLFSCFATFDFLAGHTKWALFLAAVAIVDWARVVVHARRSSVDDGAKALEAAEAADAAASRVLALAESEQEQEQEPEKGPQTSTLIAAIAASVAEDAENGRRALRNRSETRPERLEPYQNRAFLEMNRHVRELTGTKHQLAALANELDLDLDVTSGQSDREMWRFVNTRTS